MLDRVGGAPASVVPMGRRGRALILLSSTLVVGALAVAVCLAGLSFGGSAAIALPVLAVALLVPYAWAWVRFAWVGVWIDGDAVLVRSWWRRETLLKSDATRWAAVSYGGWLSVAGWPVAAGALEAGVLEVRLVDGSARTLAGSVTWRSTAVEQASFLNDWIGVERPGGGSRRSSAGEP